MKYGEVHFFKALEDGRGSKSMPDELRERAVDIMGLWARTGAGRDFTKFERHNLKLMVELSPLHRRREETEPDFYAPQAVLLDRDERIKALLVIMVFSKKEIRVERVPADEFFNLYVPVLKKGGK